MNLILLRLEVMKGKGEAEGGRSKGIGRGRGRGLAILHVDAFDQSSVIPPTYDQSLEGWV